MNESLRENLEKVKTQIDGAAEIWQYAFTKATYLVDENMPFKDEIDKAKIPSERRNWIESHEEAMSCVLANLLRLSESIRI